MSLKSSARVSSVLPILSAFILVVLPLLSPPSPVLAWDPPVQASNRTKGYWNSPYQWHNDATGVHMILMRGAPEVSHSQVLYYYGSGAPTCPSDGNNARVWNLEPNDVFADDPPYSSNPAIPIVCGPTNVNTFCGSHVALPDGRILLSGGNDQSGEGNGITDAIYYDPIEQVFQLTDAMSKRRWYPTSTTLSDGRVLVSSGRMYKQLIAFGGRDSVASTSVKNSLNAVLGLSGEFIPHATSVSGTLPAHRSGQTAVFDYRNSTDKTAETGYPHEHRMLVFGGSDSTGALLSDIWALKRTQSGVWSWAQLSPTPWGGGGGQTPQARTGHAAVYNDSSQARMYVVGGQGSSGPVKDVWYAQLRTSASGTDSWTRVSLVGQDTMAARRGHSVIFQKQGGHRLILFGGENGTTYFNDVWQLQAFPSADTSWTLLTTTGTPPAARSGHVAIYDFTTDPFPRRMIVFGGRNGTTLFRDVWQLTLPVSGTPTWSRIYPDSTEAPAARYDAAGIFDPQYRRLVILGGDSTITSPGGELSDVWEVSLKSATPAWNRVFGNLPTGPRAGLSVVHDARFLHTDELEVFTADGEEGSWQTLSAPKFQTLYPHMYLLPSGKVYYMNLPQTYLLDLASPGWTSSYSSHFEGGSSVMYRPGKIMKCGSPHNYTPTKEVNRIDLTAPSPAWTYSGTALRDARSDHNLTMLPNGQVFLSGGWKGSTSDTTNGPARMPQIWDPETNTWGDSLAIEPLYREYHSNALLLPDGRILSGGGFKNVYRFYATIYWPTYLFESDGSLATRPVVAGLDSVLTYDQTFYACLADTTPISKVSLVKPSAVTHSFNQDQRYLELEFTSKVQGGKRILTMTSPENGNYAPPGDYMLFVLTEEDVPSVARWVRVGSSSECQASPCYARSDSLTANETWTSTNGPHFVSGALKVPSGKSLTIEAGTEVLFGSSSSKLLVEGTLSVTGTSGSPVTFAPACSQTEGAWAGIEVKGSGAWATISFADIRYAYKGVRIVAPDSARVNNCTFASNQAYDIQVVGENTNRLDVAIKANSITIGGGSGVVVDSVKWGGTISGNTLTGSSSSTYGLLFEATGTDSLMTVSNNVVTGLSNGSACRIKTGKAIFTGNEFKNSKYGVEITGGTPSIGTTNAASDNLVHGNTTGIYVYCLESGSCPSSCTAAPVIRNNQIYSNGSGVRIDKTPIIGGVNSVNLGNSGASDPGNNSIYSNTSYCIRYTVSCSTVLAEGNWFGNPDCEGIPNCHTGSVDIIPFACTQPSSRNLVAVEPVGESPAAGVRFQGVMPNPSTGGVAIRLELVDGYGDVEARVFDVTGRLVRDLGRQRLSSGTGELGWDGRAESGAALSTGLYFAKIVVNGKVLTTAKILLAR